MFDEPFWSASDGAIKSSSTKYGNSVEVFFLVKSKMANVMLEILDGFFLVWVLMYQHSKSTFL